MSSRICFSLAIHGSKGHRRRVRETRPSSPSRLLLFRLGLALGAIYLVLALATRRPGWSLAVELASLAVLWGMYVARFASDAPAALLPEVLAFRLWDRVLPPAPGSIVFVGSSTIAHWTTLAADLAPLPVVRRGISGARLSQIAVLLPDLITRYGPRAVAIYAGENDLAGFLGSKVELPEAVLASFETFCRAIHDRVPAVPIYFLSIKPARARVAQAAAFNAANELVADACTVDGRLHFVDSTTPFLAADGSARADLFERDGIHLNGDGYRVLAEVVRRALG